VVDALDECNPNYATIFLEILSFIFRIENVCSVVTISTAIMQASDIEIGGVVRKPFDDFILENRFIVLDVIETPGWQKTIKEHLGKRLFVFQTETGLTPEHCERVREAILNLPNLSFFVVDLALQHLRDALSGGSSRRIDLFETQLKQLKDRAEIDSLLIDLANVRPRQSHWVL
jgi:hypothetical protein